MKDIKLHIHSYCLDYVNKRIKTCNEAMKSAQDAANEESKSSAGDKYETGRAMMQLEKEKHYTQLQEAHKLMQVLEQITPEKVNDCVGLGSLVETSKGSFYISISLGKVQVDDNDIFVVSPTSPIGIALQSKKKGDKIIFNGTDYEIKKIT